MSALQSVNQEPSMYVSGQCSTSYQSHPSVIPVQHILFFYIMISCDSPTFHQSFLPPFTQATKSEWYKAVWSSFSVAPCQSSSRIQLKEGIRVLERMPSKNGGRSWGCVTCWPSFQIWPHMIVFVIHHQQTKASLCIVQCASLKLS